ncbi:hypothetical protein DFH07DRAFT_1068380, partial [Mycena maculata]
MKPKNRPGILPQNLKDPFCRKIAVHKQAVNKWRQVMLTGKRAAMRRVTTQCMIWLSFISIALGLLSGISINACAMVLIPGTFLLLSMAVLVPRFSQISAVRLVPASRKES